jgi:hypothetical protein
LPRRKRAAPKSVRGKAPESRSPDGRKSFKSGKDAQEQLEGIEEAQQQNRARGQPNRIQSKEKSNQRLNNQLKNATSKADADKEFGD